MSPENSKEPESEYNLQENYQLTCEELESKRERLAEIEAERKRVKNDIIGLSRRKQNLERRLLKLRYLSKR